MRPWCAGEDRASCFGGLAPVTTQQQPPGVPGWQERIEVALRCISQASREETLRGFKPILADGRRAEVRVCGNDLLLQVSLPRDHQTSLQLNEAVGITGMRASCTNAIECVGQDFGLFQPLGQRDRSVAPSASAFCIAGEHAEARQVAVGPAQLGPRRETLQYLQRRLRGIFRLAPARGGPGETRDPAQILALLQAVTG